MPSQPHPAFPHPRRAALASTAAVAVAGAFALGRVSAQAPAHSADILSTASVLAKNPPPKDAPFQVLPLVQGQDASVSLVRARDELRPHYHEGREEIAYVIRGGGTMQLANEKRPVKAGDVIYIPRGVEHGFVNGAKGDTVVLSIMSPPFDGKDRHFTGPEPKSP